LRDKNILIHRWIALVLSIDSFVLGILWKREGVMLKRAAG
jgi:hypothetical protein